MKRFVIAGERRSGTSTLAKWIEVHPQLYLYPKVDQAFFLDDQIRGRNEWLDGKIDLSVWERTHQVSNYHEWFSGAGANHLVVGEKSADYFFWEPCAKRISDNIGDSLIVLVLRHPVERAWSHYWNEVGKGRECLSFEDAIDAEETRVSQSDYAKLHLSYKARGKYIQSLERWHRLFSRSQIHIVILERLISTPEKELHRLYNFLGIDANVGMDRVGKRFNHNWTTVPREFWTKSAFRHRWETKINNGVKRLTKFLFRDPYLLRKYGPSFETLTRVRQSKLKMSETTRKSLLAEFRPFTQEIQDLEGINLGEWQS